MSYILNPADLAGKAGKTVIVNPEEDGYVISDVAPPVVYRALLTQTGTNAPVATVLENTIGDITWSYIGVGTYIANLTGAFTTDKTFIMINGSGTLSVKVAFYYDEDVFRILTRNFTGGTFVQANDILDKTEVQVLVYP